MKTAQVFIRGGVGWTWLGWVLELDGLDCDGLDCDGLDRQAVGFKCLDCVRA